MSDFLSHRNQQLVIAVQFMIRLHEPHPSPCRDFSLCSSHEGLVHVVRTAINNLVMSTKKVFQCKHLLLLALIVFIFLWALRMCDINIPFSIYAQFLFYCLCTLDFEGQENSLTSSVCDRLSWSTVVIKRKMYVTELMEGLRTTLFLYPKFS